MEGQWTWGREFQHLEPKRQEYRNFRARCTDPDAFHTLFDSELIHLDLLLEGVAAPRPEILSLLRHEPSALPVQVARQVENYRSGLDLVRSIAPEPFALSWPEFLQNLHGRIAAGLDARAGHFRQEILAPLAPAHEPVEPGRVSRAIENMALWVSAPSFTDLHPVQRMTLIFARLFEIAPFSTHNLQTVKLGASLYLFHEGFPAPLLGPEHHELFFQALNRAFQFVTQDLVSLFTQAVERGLDQSIAILKQENLKL